jgi:hypothetical protein
MPGTAYIPGQIAVLTDYAHGMVLHVDGAPLQRGRISRHLTGRHHH